MKIYVMSIFVDDQDKVEKLYTEFLGFQVKHNIPLGTDRWLTVVSQEDPDGTELLLKPSDHPAAKPFKAGRHSGRRTVFFADPTGAVRLARLEQQDLG